MAGAFSAASCANVVANFCWEGILKPVGRQFGYMLCYGSYIKDLKDGVQDLEATKASLRRNLDHETRSGKKVNELASKWLEGADDMSLRANKLLNDDQGQVEKTRCSRENHFFPNPVWRYWNGRKVYKIAQSVRNHTKDAASKFNIGDTYIPILQNIVDLRDYIAFDSRNSLVAGILKALGSKEGCRRIGVYGLPGVGKTTLVKAVAEQALHDKLFSDFVLVTISQNPNIEKIQQDIGNRLGLVFEAPGSQERAIKLRERLKEEKDFLVIVDDVWKKLDLIQDIGIAFEDPQMGCKILLASRSKEVLQEEMDVRVENAFEVALLSESEAWTCFSNITGNDILLAADVKHSELKCLAIQIVKECACLPLAIRTVAGALKCKPPHAWRCALRRLQSSSVNKKVRESVKLSYDFLKNDENYEEDGDQLQKIFLFCCLHEEDANISIYDLLSLVIGWGLFQNVQTDLEAARDRLQTLLDKLKAHGLLLNGTDDDSVKMHDVIRDFGVSIAPQEPNKMFYIGTNDEFEECVDDDKLKDVLAISVGANYEGTFCQKFLKRPKLRLFWIWKRYCPLPYNFFEDAKDLRVLCLPCMSLPPTLFFLENLQTLRLVDANSSDISLIGDLKKLKALDLKGSNMEELPEQIGRLTGLRMLNLSSCYRLKVIPPNVISRLVNLEELNMSDCGFDDWKEHEVLEAQANKVSLDEIKGLTKLTALYLRVSEANKLPRDFFSTQLKRFNINLAPSNEYDHEKGSRTLKIVCFNISSLIGERGFKMLLKNSENLFIRGDICVKNNVIELDSGEDLPHLKNLEVHQNDKIKCIGETSNIFPSLETLVVCDMSKLQNMWFGELTGAESLIGKSREAKVESWDKYLKREGGGNSELAGAQCIKFPRLKVMELKCLPNLIGFWSERDSLSCTPSQPQNAEEYEELLSTTDSASILFNKKVAFPSLERLELTKLNVKGTWWDMKLSEISSCNCYNLQSLRMLTVLGCHSLKYLFTFPVARSLVQLETLNVRQCTAMEDIILPPLLVDSDDELAAQVDHRIEFSKLKNMDLAELPYDDIRFSSESDQGQGSSGDSATTFFNTKVSFPSLETLTLRYLACKRVWAEQLPVETSYSFERLTTLEIRGCHRLKYALSFAIAKSLVQLQKLEVSNCREMEDILDVGTNTNKKTVAAVESLLEVPGKKFLPKLEQVLLKDLPNLSRLCTTDVLTCCLNVKELNTKNCPLRTEGHHHEDISCDNRKADRQLEIMPSPNDQQLPRFYVFYITTLKVEDVNSENLLSASLAAAFVHLAFLNVSDCKFMKVVVVTEKLKQGRMPREKICLPALKDIYLRNLPNLKMFCTGDHIQCQLLESLHINECPDFTTFISSSTDEETELEAIQPFFHDQKITFPKLTELNVWSYKSEVLVGDYYCGSLSRLVMRGVKSVDYFNLLLPNSLKLDGYQHNARKTFQNLESLQSVEYCGCEKSLPSWVSFRGLTVLHASFCRGMEYLLSPSTAKSLQLLKVMVIRCCWGMTEIIRAKDHDDELSGSSSSSSSSPSSNSIVFNNLEFLVLSCMSSLTSFHSGNCAFEFPKLTNVVVSDCPEMSSFCPRVTIASPDAQIFMTRNDTEFWELRTNLNSNGQLQVNYDVFQMDLWGVENFIWKERVGSHININATIQHFKENPPEEKELSEYLERKSDELRQEFHWL